MRLISLRVALPWLVVFLGSIAFVALRGGLYGVIFTSAFFLVYALAARQLIASSHLYGMQCFRRKRFEEAIFQFEQSYEFFDRHSWLDDWRGLFLCSSSPLSYRDMALLNQAYCYCQTGNRAKAFETYHLCLKRFPSSVMAESGLRTLEAARSER